MLCHELENSVLLRLKIKSFKTDVYIQCNPNKNLSRIFYGKQQIDSKFMRKGKRLKIAKILFKKRTKLRNSYFLISRLTIKTTVIKTVQEMS